jgi:Leucine-rich repeat (LRR) protein/GTPase SAR1 family protein
LPTYVNFRTPNTLTSSQAVTSKLHYAYSVTGLFPERWKCLTGRVPPGVDEANRRIDEALRAARPALDLSDLGLFEVPSRVRELTDLTELRLSENRLRELPPWVGTLAGLTHLDLEDNRLSHVPDGFPALTHLAVRRNRLTEVPEWLVDRPDLTVLDLRDNRLTALPEWLAGRTTLRELLLDDNRLDGLPAWLGGLTDLTTLRVAGCRLAEVPDWVRGLGRLTQLYLGDNRLTTVPDWLGELTGLTKLSLVNNCLTALPEQLARLVNLTSLALTGNRLTELPEWLGELTGLTELFVRSNRLRSLPTSLASLTGLTELYVSGNQLAGLPGWLGELTALTELDLGDCALTAVPDWVAALPKLTHLYLDGNELTAVPAWLAGRTELTELWLDNNPLTELPAWFGTLTGLDKLSLDGCPLDSLPSSFGALTNLTTLWMSDTRLTRVPDTITGLASLTTLFLNGNRITELPERLGALPVLRRLSVARNMLSALPELPDLDVLDVSDNDLTELPGWLADRTALTELSLSYNKLTVLPAWLGNLTDLTHLKLSGCDLAELPDSLATLTALTVLHAHNNKLTALPDWLGDVTGLETLWLNYNQLTVAPEPLRRLTGLTSLWLGDNPLTGLPDWLGELSLLNTLEMNSCQLSTLPDELSALRNLRHLHTDRNQLTQLPGWLADLRGLVTLSVNSNQLTELPERLTELGCLASLSVSGNQLNGLPEWLAGLTGLTSLSAGGCGLDRLPDGLSGLTTLELADNRLTTLPDSMAALTNLRHLTLRDNPLTTLGPIATLQRLETLDLGGCHLGEVPDHLAALRRLTTLDLTGNDLTELPRWITSLSRLSSLNLSDNELRALPDDLGRLAGLVTLNLSNNRLDRVPDGIGDLSGLKQLYLYKNELTALPDDIGRLTHLTALSVGDNAIATLPEEIGALTRLATLHLGDNSLRALPDSIGSLRRLTRLYLGNNRLTALPDSMRQLSGLTTLLVYDNELTTLPHWLVDLPELSDLSAIGNPLVSPPPEIAVGGSTSVLAFLLALRHGSEPQWLSKLLVVGEGGVGKTSVIKALDRAPHDPDEPSTHGLMIKELRLDHPSVPDREMRLATWDFGGQEIYHATHQFFLTDRSLFLLLWNARLGWEQGRLHYWLDIITARAPESPIILVATHIHGRPVDLPLAELRAKYPRIVASVQVDNETRDGIEELRTLLAGRAAELPLMGSEWPVDWLVAAEALRGAAENHVTPARMWELMKSAGVTDRDQQRYIAGALHVLGDILYDADDPELSQLVVLHPSWVNEFISKVLDSDQVAQRHGLLTREHLNELWAELDRGVRDHLLGMMDKYDLSYRIEGGATDLSLVVERLQWDPPSYEDTWHSLRRQPEIKVIYRLNTMPPGIPTWFIARSHRFSKGVHWRTGALLGHGDGQHLALVTADRHRNVLELAVRGPSPAGFFMVLDDGLNLTLERFPGLDITREVPCRCEEGCTELFNYENLRARLTRTPPRYEIECHRSGEPVSVPQLLLGLAPSERDATRASIDQFAKTVAQLGDRLTEQSDYIQRLLLRLQRLAQTQQEARCPSVFAVVNADRKRLTGTAYEIHLYCEEPGAWHRLPEPRGVYPVTQPAEWFRKLGPYLQHLLTVLKHAAPLTGPVLGVAVGTLDEQIKADCELMKELAAQVPKEVRHQGDLPGTVTPEPTPDSHATTDADFRALKAMLTKLDPDESWGGLSRTTTPEGLTLYLCEHHVAQYHQRAPG